MREAGGTIRSLRATGGGTQSVLWPQLVSDITGLPQSILAGAGGGGQGAALLAAVAAGAADLDEGWPRGHVKVQPDPTHDALHDELYAMYRRLYPATRAEAHALADLQSGHRREEEPEG